MKCSRNVKICTDAVFTDATQDKSYDIVILPGGLNGSKAFQSVSLIWRYLTLKYGQLHKIYFASRWKLESC